MTAQVYPMPTASGFVYVIDNPGMPGLSKVGQTTRTPQERADELHTTGSAHPYRVVAAWAVADVRASEQAAHAALARWRTSDTREWFAMPSDRAVAVLRGVFTDDVPTRRRFSLWRLIRGCVEAFGWVGVVGLALGKLLT